MASTTITFRADFEWRDEEPDEGIVCIACGDTVFGAFKRLHIQLNGGPFMASREHCVCQSCADVAEL